MRVERADPYIAKGWYIGPWNSPIEAAIGYANEGIAEPHLHENVTEVYLVARGTTEIRVETESVVLVEGDVIVVEPGEAHTFVSSSPDYFHFVLHLPGLAGAQAPSDKISVAPTRLEL